MLKLISTCLKEYAKEILKKKKKTLLKINGEFFQKHTYTKFEENNIPWLKQHFVEDKTYENNKKEMLIHFLKLISKLSLKE